MLENDLAELKRRKCQKYLNQWNRMRRIEAEQHAAHLRKAPAQTVLELQTTLQGCELLIERGEALADILGSYPIWLPEQVQMAFDLMGVPVELRRGNRLFG